MCSGNTTRELALQSEKGEKKKNWERLNNGDMIPGLDTIAVELPQEVLEWAVDVLDFSTIVEPSKAMSDDPARYMAEMRKLVLKRQAEVLASAETGNKKGAYLDSDDPLEQGMFYQKLRFAYEAGLVALTKLTSEADDFLYPVSLF